MNDTIRHVIDGGYTLHYLDNGGVALITATVLDAEKAAVLAGHLGCYRPPLSVAISDPTDWPDLNKG